MNTQTPWWQPGLMLFLRMSSWIAGPILIATFVGKYLDKKYHKEPWLFLLSVGIAFIISTGAILYYGMREMNKIAKEAKDKKNSQAKERKLK